MFRVSRQGCRSGSMFGHHWISDGHIQRNSRETRQMRTILTTTLLALAITTFAAFGADNTLGTWKLNVAKSKYTPAPFPLKSLTVTREGSDGGVKQTVTGERADGTMINATSTAKYDGTPVSVTGQGAPYDT